MSEKDPSIGQNFIAQQPNIDTPENAEPQEKEYTDTVRRLVACLPPVNLKENWIHGYGVVYGLKEKAIDMRYLENLARIFSATITHYKTTEPENTDLFHSPKLNEAYKKFVNTIFDQVHLEKRSHTPSGFDHSAHFRSGEQGKITAEVLAECFKTIITDPEVRNKLEIEIEEKQKSRDFPEETSAEAEERFNQAVEIDMGDYSNTEKEQKREEFGCQKWYDYGMEKIGLSQVAVRLYGNQRPPKWD